MMYNPTLDVGGNSDSNRSQDNSYPTVTPTDTLQTQSYQASQARVTVVTIEFG
jgi:hypothetical protein